MLHTSPSHTQQGVGGSMMYVHVKEDGMDHVGAVFQDKTDYKYIY